MKLYYCLIIICFINIVGIANAEESGGTLIGKQNDCITLPQECASCSYVTLTSIQYPNMSRSYINTAMTEQGTSYNYSFCDTSQLGKYIYCVVGDVDGTDTVACKDFEITATGGDKGGSMFFLIIITSLAVVFLIATLFVNEEFFVYICGVLFLIGGVYLMINGLDVLNDVNTRYLAYVYLGIGMLFTLGAYIYNSYSRRYEEEEY
jgi:hypothetical protein